MLIKLIDLNDALFPPRYNGPYPITRGIRVEIAAMVLLCLLGVVSQLKAWKLVKNHRDRKAAARMDEEKRQSQAEFDIGRDLEDGNREDRAAWEAVYGQSNGKARQADSGVGTGSTVTPNRASTSVHEADVIISGEKKPAGNSDEKPHLPPKVTVRVASEDSIYEMPSRSVENLLSDGIEDRAESASGRRVDPSKQLTTHPNNSAIDGEEFQTETHMETPFSPPIVPLPFTIPMEEPQQMDDRSSVATFAETDHLPNRMSRKLSVSSLFQRLSTRSKRRSPVSVAAEGESMMSYNDDRASSIAATMDVGDGLLSEAGTPDLERQTPPLDIADETASSKPPRSVDTPLLTLENLNVGHLPTTETPTNNQGPTDHITDADHATQDRDQNSPVQGPNGAKTEDRLTPESRQDLEVNSIAASGTSEKRAVPASLRDQLPEGPPGIVMTYRTNEWAKHLGQADAPPPESLRRVSSSARSSPIMTEGAAPVNVHELTQTPLNAWPLPMKIDTKLDRSATSSRDSLPSQQHHQPPLPQKSSLRGSSYGKSINRTSSQTSLEQPRASRRSSAPLVNAPFVDSPIEEDVETSFPQRGNRSYTPTNTLMAKRNNKLQTRYSSTSLARTGSSGSSGSSNNGYIPANQVIENPTAAHRKSLLQRQYSRSPRPRNTPRTSASYSPYQTDSGPTSPVENNTSIASAWRSSLRNDASAERLSDQQMEARRNELLSQKRRASAGAQAAGAERMRRESQQDLGVRKGDLLERHKEAMRRMQAGVAL